jgi:hypothetical protein
MLELRAQLGRERARQRRDTILASLAVAHQNLATLDVEILHAKTHAFAQAQPGPIQHARDQPRRSRHAGEQSPNLIWTQHDRQTDRPPRSHEPLELELGTLQHHPVQEHERRERLILCRRRHTMHCSELREKLADLARPHLVGMPRPAVEHKAPHPVHVRPLRPHTVVPHPTRLPHPIQQPRRPSRPRAPRSRLHARPRIRPRP